MGYNGAILVCELPKVQKKLQHIVDNVKLLNKTERPYKYKTGFIAVIVNFWIVKVGKMRMGELERNAKAKAELKSKQTKLNKQNCEACDAHADWGWEPAVE